MDSKYDLITVSFDGTHNLWTRFKLQPKNDYSYKLKDFGYNIMVFVYFVLLM
jgi:hypothetical protein